MNISAAFSDGIPGAINVNAPRVDGRVVGEGAGCHYADQLAVVVALSCTNTWKGDDFTDVDLDGSGDIDRDSIRLMSLCHLFILGFGGLAALAG